MTTMMAMLRMKRKETRMAVVLNAYLAEARLGRC
jgi:hypothetical protein